MQKPNALLKALITDDERSVRQEMRRLDAWEKHGITIIGEAESGEAALRFLEEHPVDLLVTDLGMPGLSGMEYLREVRRRFPDLHVAVLTMHRDFDLLQEAMRLGVDDYITKAQFDRNSIDGILESMLSRIGNLPGEGRCTADTVVCLYYPQGISFSITGHVPDSAPSRRLDDYFAIRETGTDSAIPEGALSINVSAVKGLKYRQLLEALRTFTAEELFYRYVPDRRRYSCCFGDCFGDCLYDKKNDAVMEERKAAKELVGTRGWLLEGRTFDTLLKKLPQTRMIREQLLSFFYQPLLMVSPWLKMDAEDYFNNTQGLFWWYQWKDWLLSLREGLREYMDADSASVHIIHKAVIYIGEHYTEDMGIRDILNVTAMSKSHFSALFKEITGQTFGEYLKNMRLETAKRLLLETGRPIGRIGEDVGYPDERYFRRIFLECAGISPAQYRKQTSPDFHT